jgi:hypothetical protein
MWVDALCTGQSNVAERESRVRLMWSIYQKSSRVVIWLGTGTRGSEGAFELLRLIPPSGGWQARNSTKPYTYGESQRQGVAIKNFVSRFSLGQH